jgi:hypothetical protein
VGGPPASCQAEPASKTTADCRSLDDKRPAQKDKMAAKDLNQTGSNLIGHPAVLSCLLEVE